DEAAVVGLELLRPLAVNLPPADRQRVVLQLVNAPRDSFLVAHLPGDVDRLRVLRRVELDCRRPERLALDGDRPLIPLDRERVALPHVVGGLHPLFLQGDHLPLPLELLQFLLLVVGRWSAGRDHQYRGEQHQHPGRHATPPRGRRTLLTPPPPQPYFLWHSL